MDFARTRIMKHRLYILDIFADFPDMTTAKNNSNK